MIFVRSFIFFLSFHRSRVDINLKLWLNFSINKPTDPSSERLTDHQQVTYCGDHSGAASPATVCADGTEPGDI